MLSDYDRFDLITEFQLKHEPMHPESLKMTWMIAIGKMAEALESGEDSDYKAFADAVQSMVKAKVRGEFDAELDTGVAFEIPTPEDPFNLKTDDILDLVMDCFEDGIDNLQINVRPYEVGFYVNIYFRL